MRFGKSAAASICIVGAGLLAAGCSPSSSSSSSSSSSASSASSSPVSSATTSASAAAGAAATTTDCTVSGLSFAFSTKTGTAAQETQVVDFTNTGSAACTMEGFPGVNLVGAANGSQNYSWPLVRSSAKYSQVTLQPGGKAHFDLTYLPFVKGEGTDISVAKIVLTPPNTRSQAQLNWPQQIQLQDTSTHPGTYISPVTAGA